MKRQMKRASVVLLVAAILATPMSTAADGKAVVNINTAGPEALAEAINGVGLKRAEEIVREREENGPFKSVDELSRVQGIGERIIERSRQRLTVD